MSKDFRKLDRIPAEQLTAYERWELPLLDREELEPEEPPAEPPVLEEEVIEVKPLTAEELEAIRQAAWEEGQREGYQAGHEEGRQAGYEEGFRQGQTEGHAQGLAQGIADGQQQGQAQKQAEIDDMLARLESVMGELLDPIRQQQAEIEQAILCLTVALSRAIIHRELSLDSSQILRVVEEALAALPRSSERIRLYLNPKDLPHIRELAQRRQEEWQIIEAPDVLPGGCRVETRDSLVDHTLQRRFQVAVQQLLEQQLQVRAQGPEALQPTELYPDLLESSSTQMKGEG